MNSSNTINSNLVSSLQAGTAGTQNTSIVSAVIQQALAPVPPPPQAFVSANANFTNIAVHSFGGNLVVRKMDPEVPDLCRRLNELEDEYEDEDEDFRSPLFCGVCPGQPWLITEETELYSITEADETDSIYEEAESATSEYSQPSMDDTGPSSSDTESESLESIMASLLASMSGTPVSSATSSSPQSMSFKDATSRDDSNASDGEVPPELNVPPVGPEVEQGGNAMESHAQLYSTPSSSTSLDVSEQRPVAELTEEMTPGRCERGASQSRRMARVFDADLSYRPSREQLAARLAGMRQHDRPREIDLSSRASQEQITARYEGSAREAAGISYRPSREQLASRFTGSRRQNVGQGYDSTRRRANVFDVDTRANMYRCADGPYVLRSDAPLVSLRETRFVTDAVEPVAVKAPKKQNKIKKCFKKLSKVFRICRSDI